jgi:hypothetical protein
MPMPKKMKNIINTKGAWPVGKLACNKADANAGW